LIFIRAMVASTSISSHRVAVLSVCPAIISQVGVLLKRLNARSCQQCHAIAQGLQFSDAENFGKNQTGSPQRRHQIQVGYVKCSWGSWKLVTVDRKCSQAVTSLSHLQCVILGLWATSDPCLYQPVVWLVTVT